MDTSARDGIPPAMRIVVAEAIADAGTDLLRAHCEVDMAVGVDRDELLDRLAEADGLIVRSGTRVDAELLSAAPRLRAVGRAGIGVDNIDLEAATAAGVVVVNAPLANAISAAEHTMALLLGQARRIPEADRSLRSGRWEKSRLQGVELHGKTLGIVGLGRIGSLVAGRAAAFGMHLIAYDPYVGPERARRLGVEPVPDLATLLAQSDFVTVHLPLTRQTRHLIDAKALAAIRPGARLVNASRGDVVDEKALADAIRSGRVAGAALDVFSEEPLTGSPLFDLPEVVLTPHLGAATAEAQDKAGLAVAEAVVEVLRGELVPGAVNVDAGPDIPDEVMPHLPLARHLGAVFVALAEGLPSILVVRVEGTLSDSPVRPLALAALTGALAGVSSRPVSYANAPAVAADHGLSVVEEATGESADYLSVVRLSGVCGGEQHTVAGSVMRGKGPVLIEAFGHRIELPLSPSMLILLNDDVPGMIGKVGTFLGDRGVNIANMVVGRPATDDDTALMGLNLDRGLEAGELAALRAIAGIKRAILVESDR